VEVVRLVADITETGYIRGMPLEGWLKEAICFRRPSFGDVGSDPAYPTHNAMFSPVQFPLVLGNTWETMFAAATYVAVVEFADEYTATIRYGPDECDSPDAQISNLVFAAGGSMMLEYDARQHEIVGMEGGLGTWEVVEHGYGYEGWVTVPRGEDTAIDYGVLGPASNQTDVRERTLEVTGNFNRMTMMHFVGTMNDSPGQLEVRQVTPDGDEWITASSGAATIEFFQANYSVGTWTT
jgi:hypothetical protein